MLFGKPKLAAEERRARIEEIEALISADKSAEAYAKARRAGEARRCRGGAVRGVFRLMAENVREDASAAARYAEKYARSTPDDARGWRRLGYAQMTQRNFADAAEALEKAYRLGDTESGVMLAAACKILADGLRNEAAGTLNVAAFGKANGQAMTLYTQACALCEKIGSEQPGLMDDADWQGYGRSFDMMYALSLNGETKSFRVTDKALLDYLSVTQAFEGGKKDAVSHAYWLAVAVRGCSLMDKAGYRAMAEYFRAGAVPRRVRREEGRDAGEREVASRPRVGARVHTDGRTARLVPGRFCRLPRAVRQDAEKVRPRDGSGAEKGAAAGPLGRVSGGAGARGGTRARCSCRALRPCRAARRRRAKRRRRRASSACSADAHAARRSVTWFH